ncbi:1,4-dihydroxy-2-naphthoate octaprenyltransferase [Psychrobacter sp. I-STPA6b]|uniref:1,4-dihydroxy-2-naphthoate octaprenyltransferase n=1 Tax=Psychrobacter sp. I-STPA6b TaxID=2585718 RepID=UPI001D0C4800|nr:1,4-dihydroxy-2-naphthoate octaprenyltransferase [Psychrobacter sp. I-STPA6b]
MSSSIKTTVINFIQATRPRTFMLAVASIICGNALAYHQLAGFDLHHWGIFLLSLWVALALQILSNLANDYGDGIKGTDDLRATDSPQRLTAQGQLDPKRLKRWIIIWAWLTFFSGVGLIYWAFDSISDLLLFLGFGIVAIFAAMAYTMGKRPYGYRAMGEVAVLIFFGWLAVLGSCYLQTQRFAIPTDLPQLLPATGCGLLASCVLYLNNMRDIDSDKQAGKITVAVLLGKEQMRKGYFALLAVAILLYVVASYYYGLASLLWLLTLPLIIRHIKYIQQVPQKIGTQLPKIVLLTFFINLLFALGIVI